MTKSFLFLLLALPAAFSLSAISMESITASSFYSISSVTSPSMLFSLRLESNFDYEPESITLLLAFETSLGEGLSVQYSIGDSNFEDTEPTENQSAFQPSSFSFFIDIPTPTDNIGQIKENFVYSIQIKLITTQNPSSISFNVPLKVFRTSSSKENPIIFEANHLFDVLPIKENPENSMELMVLSENTKVELDAIINCLIAIRIVDDFTEKIVLQNTGDFQIYSVDESRDCFLSTMSSISSAQTSLDKSKYSCEFGISPNNLIIKSIDSTFDPGLYVIETSIQAPSSPGFHSIVIFTTLLGQPYFNKYNKAEKLLEAVAYEFSSGYPKLFFSIGYEASSSNLPGGVGLYTCYGFQIILNSFVFKLKLGSTISTDSRVEINLGSSDILVPTGYANHDLDTSQTSDSETLLEGDKLILTNVNIEENTEYFVSVKVGYKNAETLRNFGEIQVKNSDGVVLAEGKVDYVDGFDEVKENKFLTEPEKFVYESSSFSYIGIPFRTVSNPRNNKYYDDIEMTLNTVGLKKDDGMLFFVQTNIGPNKYSFNDLSIQALTNMTKVYFEVQTPKQITTTMEEFTNNKILDNCFFYSGILETNIEDFSDNTYYGWKNGYLFDIYKVYFSDEPVIAKGGDRIFGLYPSIYPFRGCGMRPEELMNSWRFKGTEMYAGYYNSDDDFVEVLVPLWGSWLPADEDLEAKGIIKPKNNYIGWINVDVTDYHSIHADGNVIDVFWNLYIDETATYTIDHLETSPAVSGFENLFVFDSGSSESSFKSSSIFYNTFFWLQWNGEDNIDFSSQDGLPFTGWFMMQGSFPNEFNSEAASLSLFFLGLRPLTLENSLEFECASWSISISECKVFPGVGIQSYTYTNENAGTEVDLDIINRFALDRIDIYFDKPPSEFAFGFPVRVYNSNFISKLRDKNETPIVFIDLAVLNYNKEILSVSGPPNMNDNRSGNLFKMGISRTSSFLKHSRLFSKDSEVDSYTLEKADYSDKTTPMTYIEFSDDPEIGGSVNAYFKTYCQGMKKEKGVSYYASNSKCKYSDSGFSSTYPMGVFCTNYQFYDEDSWSWASFGTKSTILASPTQYYDEYRKENRYCIVTIRHRNLALSYGDSSNYSDANIRIPNFKYPSSSRSLPKDSVGVFFSRLGKAVSILDLSNIMKKALATSVDPLISSVEVTTHEVNSIEIKLSSSNLFLSKYSLIQLKTSKGQFSLSSTSGTSCSIVASDDSEEVYSGCVIVGVDSTYYVRIDTDLEVDQYSILIENFYVYQEQVNSDGETVDTETEGEVKYFVYINLFNSDGSEQLGIGSSPFAFIFTPSENKKQLVLSVKSETFGMLAFEIEWSGFTMYQDYYSLRIQSESLKNQESMHCLPMVFGEETFYTSSSFDDFSLNSTTGELSFSPSSIMQYQSQASLLCYDWVLSDHDSVEFRASVKIEMESSEVTLLSDGVEGVLQEDGSVDELSSVLIADDSVLPITVFDWVIENAPFSLIEYTFLSIYLGHEYANDLSVKDLHCLFKIDDDDYSTIPCTTFKEDRPKFLYLMDLYEYLPEISTGDSLSISLLIFGLPGLPFSQSNSPSVPKYYVHYRTFDNIILSREVSRSAKTHETNQIALVHILLSQMSSDVIRTTSSLSFVFELLDYSISASGNDSLLFILQLDYSLDYNIIGILSQRTISVRKTQAVKKSEGNEQYLAYSDYGSEMEIDGELSENIFIGELAFNLQKAELYRLTMGNVTTNNEEEYTNPYLGQIMVYSKDSLQLVAYTPVSLIDDELPLTSGEGPVDDYFYQKSPGEVVYRGIYNLVSFEISSVVNQGFEIGLQNLHEAKWTTDLNSFKLEPSPSCLPYSKTMFFLPGFASVNLTIAVGNDLLIEKYKVGMTTENIFASVPVIDLVVLEKKFSIEAPETIYINSLTGSLPVTICLEEPPVLEVEVEFIERKYNVKSTEGNSFVLDHEHLCRVVFFYLNTEEPKAFYKGTLEPHVNAQINVFEEASIQFIVENRTTTLNLIESEVEFSCDTTSVVSSGFTIECSASGRMSIFVLIIQEVYAESSYELIEIIDCVNNEVNDNDAIAISFYISEEDTVFSQEVTWALRGVPYSLFYYGLDELGRAYSWSETVLTASPQKTLTSIEVTFKEELDPDDLGFFICTAADILNLPYENVYLMEGTNCYTTVNSTTESNTFELLILPSPYPIADDSIYDDAVEALNDEDLTTASFISNLVTIGVVESVSAPYYYGIGIPELTIFTESTSYSSKYAYISISGSVGGRIWATLHKKGEIPTKKEMIIETPDTMQTVNLVYETKGEVVQVAFALDESMDGDYSISFVTKSRDPRDFAETSDIKTVYFMRINQKLIQSISEADTGGLIDESQLEEDEESATLLHLSIILGLAFELLLTLL